MAFVVVIDQMAFQKVKLDEDGNRTIQPDGDEVIVKKGNYVPDWVPEWQRNAFQQSGMIGYVADRPEPEPVAEVGPPAPAKAEPVVVETPAPGASRADWEAFATGDAVGMTAEEAASFPNKAALIDAVDARLNQK